MLAANDQVVRSLTGTRLTKRYHLLTGKGLIIARLIPRRLIDFLDTTDQLNLIGHSVRSFE